MVIIGFCDFKNCVLEKGGIWASCDVYFTQFRDGYSASYKPNYPEHSKEDCAIFYNWLTGKWSYMPPDIYDRKYQKVLDCKI